MYNTSSPSNTSTDHYQINITAAFNRTNAKITMLQHQIQSLQAQIRDLTTKHGNMQNCRLSLFLREQERCEQYNDQYQACQAIESEIHYSQTNSEKLDHEYNELITSHSAQKKYYDKEISSLENEEMLKIVLQAQAMKKHKVQIKQELETSDQLKRQHTKNNDKIKHLNGMIEQAQDTEVSRAKSITTMEAK